MTATFEEADRRAYPRLSAHWPCKVYNPISGRYIPGETMDVSENGAQIMLAWDTNLGPGQTLSIGIARKRRQGIIRTDTMFDATVVRVTPIAEDGARKRLVIAVHFNVDQAGATRTARAA
jgi:hypothetical protein